MAKKPKRMRLLKKRAKNVKKELVPVVTEKATELSPLPQAPQKPTLENVPQITTENIGEHREQVLSGARKYIYPLRHSKRTIVGITITVIVGALIGLFIYCSLALYKYYQYNSFLYRVTQVVPFPVAKAGGHYVDYENYLFELRHYVHYYESQQQRNFGGADRDQLLAFRKQALQDVINAAYIKQLAGQNRVSVSDKEVNDRLNEVRDQNRLGGNNKVFADVLRDYWGWSVNDFKRSLKQEILAEKVAAKLDAKANSKAQAAAQEAANSKANFADLAKKYSDDAAAKDNGGDYGFVISRTNPNVPPEVVNALYNMKVGQVSGVIIASPVLAGQGPSLQIVKLTGIKGGGVTAQHITINLQNPSVFIKQLEQAHPFKAYVHF